MKAKIKDFIITHDHHQFLTLELLFDFRPFFEKLKDKLLNFEPKEWRERRSLDANAYAWKLVSEIADNLTANGYPHTKEDIYLECLKKYGQGGIVKIRNKDKDSLLREVKYYEEHEQLYADNAAYYKIWVGSSNYNTHEMFLFIKGVVADAEELGIDTRTTEEIARMVSLYASAE